MALEIVVDTSKATRPVTALNKALDEVVSKIKAISDAFKSVSVDKLTTAKKEMQQLNTAMKDSKTAAAAINETNKVMEKQLDLLKQSSSAKNQNKKSSDDLTKSQSKEDAQTRALAQVKKELLNAEARYSVIMGENSKKYKERTMAVERLKLAEQAQAAETRANLILKDQQGKADFEAMVKNKELTKVYEQQILVTQRLAATKESYKNKSLQQTEADKLQIETLQKLARAKAMDSEEYRKSAAAIANLEAKHKRLMAELIKENSETKKSTVASKAKTDALRKQTSATHAARNATREFSRSLADGNKYAAEFRAALAGLGLHFGIYTGSTIVAAAATYGMVRGFRAIIEAGAEFEFTMDRVTGVMNTTMAESMALEGQVRSLAETTQFTAGEVSKGLVFLGMAGFQTNEALMALEPTLRLAQIGMIDMEQAADMVTNIMAGFNLEAGQIAETVDKLSIVVTSSNTSITQLAQALSYVGPAAANTNTTLEETTAIIGFFGNVGIKATRAGTALRRGIANLSNPTDDMAQRMADLGIAINGSDGRMRSMLDIMTDLSEAGATMTDIFEIFGTRAGPAFASAIIRGTDSIKELVEAQRDAKGTSEALASILEDNAWTEFKLVVSAMHEVLISFYDLIDGPLRVALRGMISLFQNMAAGVKLLVPVFKVLGSALAALGIIKLVGYFKQLTYAIALAQGPIMAVGTAATAAAAANRALFVSLAGLKAAFAALISPMGLLVAGIGSLVYMYFSASSAAEEFEEHLRTQKELIDDLNTLSLASGIESVGDTGNGALDDALDKLKQLKAQTGETIGAKLAQITQDTKTEVNEASAAYTEAKKNFDNARYDSRRSQAQKDELYEALQLAKARKDSAEKIEAAVKGQLEAYESLGKELGGINVLTLTEKELTAEIAAVRQKDIDALKEKEKAERTKITQANRELAIAEKRQELEEIITGDIMQQVKEREKAIKVGLKSAFRDVSAEIGTEKTAADDKVITLLNDRALLIGELKGKAEELKGEYVNLIDDFEKGQLQVDLLKAAVPSEKLDLIEKYFAEVRKLEAQQIIDQVKYATILGENELQAMERTHKEVLITMDRHAKVELQKAKDLAKFEQGGLDFKFENRLIGLKEYADESVRIQQSITDNQIQSASQLLVTETQFLQTLQQKKAVMADAGDATEAITALITQQSDAVYTLTQNIAELNAKRADETDNARITIEAIRNWVTEAAKANLKLETQLNLLQKGTVVTRDSTQQMYDFAIAQTVAALATAKNKDELQKLLDMLIIMRDEYDANKLKINEFGQAWNMTADQMAQKADSAAESMMNAFSDFFLDPSKDGLDQLLDHFVNTLQKMAAEALAAQLFSDSGGGFGGVFANLFTMFAGGSGTKNNVGQDFGLNFQTPTIPNNATGADWKVKGSGGIDSELVKFWATPGERVTVSNPNGGDDRRMEREGSKSVTFNNVINVEAKGGDKAEIGAIVQQGLDALERKMIMQQARTQKPMGIR